MKKTLTLLLLFFSLGTFHLNAQLQSAYFNTFSDDFVDTLYQTTRVIPLDNGDLAIAVLTNRPGQVEFAVNVYRINADNEVVTSIELGPIGEASSAQLAEGPDGSIWVAYAVLETDGFVREQTRIVQLSASLDSVLAETTFNLSSGREQTRGLYVDENQIVVISRGGVFSDSLGFALRTLNMAKLSPTTLEVEERVPDFFPKGGFASSGYIEILPVGDDRLAMAVRVDKDSTSGADIFVIREYAIADLSLLAEYELRGISRDSYSMDFAYIPQADAYAATNRSFNTFLFRRNDMATTVIDTILAPEGARGNFSRTGIVYSDSTLYVLGQSSYQISFAVGAADTAVAIEVPTNRFSRKELNANGQIVAVSGSNSENFQNPLFIIAFGDSVAANDTLSLLSASSSEGVSFYNGIPAIQSTTGEDAEFLGLRFQGIFPEIGTTWGQDIIDAETGDLTGKRVTTNDISFWQPWDFDPEMPGIVATNGGYMGYINERFTRISFFKFDRDFNVLQPDSVGFGAIDFPDFPSFLSDRINSSTATSYGVVGTTNGEIFEGPNTGYRPYVFAMDTNFVARIAATIDTFNYYPFNPISLAVDSADKVYTLGIQAGSNGQFSLSDTLNLIAHEADGAVRYAQQIALNTGYDFANPAVNKIMLNSDQSELLISGVYSDSTFTRLGFIIRVNTTDGSVVGQTVLHPNDIGQQNINSHQAVYDPNDNVVLNFVSSQFASSGVFTNNLRSLQLDADGNIIGDEISFTLPLSFINLSSVSVIGEGIYLSGNYSSISRVKDQAFLTRVNTGTLVSTKDQKEDVSEEMQFSLFPNPAFDQVILSWENEQASEYRLQVIDLMGRTLQQWTGEQGAGTVQIEVGLQQLPKGTYFVRLDLPQGYLLKPVVKQ